MQNPREQRRLCGKAKTFAARLLAVLLVIYLFPSLTWAQSLHYYYDNIGRLTRVTYSDGTSVDYVYDSAGNRLTKRITLPGGPANQPPLAPANPGIPNSASNVSTTPLLSWNGTADTNSSDATVYLTYFGTSPTPPLVLVGPATNWSPGQLQGLTTYYWYVVARNSQNLQATGALWSFTTGVQPPLAAFTVSPSSGLPPLTVSFRDLSRSADSSIVSWEWDFNQDGIIDSTAQNPTFQYTTPGLYSVALRVHDALGQAATAVLTNAVLVLGSNSVILSPLSLSIGEETAFRHFRVTYSVTNEGTASVNQPLNYVDELYLSPHAVFDSSVVSAARFLEYQPFFPGSVYTRSREVFIPSSISDQSLPNYFLLLKPDSQNAVSFANRVLAKSFAGHLPDLVPISMTWTGLVVGGGNLAVSYTVSNQGPNSVDAQWTDALFISSNSVLDLQATVLSVSAPAKWVLPNGGNYVATNNVTLPDWPPGPYYLILAANYGDALIEATGTNNFLAVPLTITAPDLVPVDLRLIGGNSVTSTVPEAAVSVSWTVQNRGTGPAGSAPWDDTLSVSSNAVPDTNREMVLDFPENLLSPLTVPAGGSYTVTNLAYLSVSASGSYYLILSVNNYQTLPETDYSNNVLSVPFTFTLAPQLFLIESGPAAAFLGRNLTYTVSVINGGFVSAGGVLVTDQLPPALALVSSQVSQGSVSASSGPLAWNAGTLDPQKQATWTILATANAQGTITNVVVVTSPSLMSNVTAAAVTTILNASSQQPVLSIGISNNVILISWTAIPGRPYQVQYKNDLGAATWSNLAAAVTATGVVAYASDTLAMQTAKFYRVALAGGAAPSILLQPVNQTAAVGGVVFFVVAATGSPPLFYQWQKNGANLAGATSNLLWLASVQLADAGSYDAVVSNAWGSVTSASAVLTVGVPPTITVQPMDQTVNAGSDATFSVTATGSTPLYYQWQMNGSDLPGATSTSLLLHNVQPANAGFYDVLVTNFVGSVVSDPALLTVQ